MKKILITVIASMLAVVGYAQSSMLATLSQNGEISTFYGTQAFVNAYNAAEDGAVINLSSGTFTATDIKKGITIRGAGMAIDATTNSEPTILTDDFLIGESTSHLTIEGIYHNHKITYQGNIKDLTLIRCRFNKIEQNDKASILQNATFINCRISNGITTGTRAACISFVNSIIVDPHKSGSGSDDSSSEYSNCIIIKDDINSFYYSTFKNCIFGGNHSSSPWMMSTNIAYNCVFTEGKIFDAFNQIQNNTNSSDLYTSVFKTFTGTYADDELFELTDDAKKKYLGLDGTQIGIYGGAIPYSSTPSTPRIVKCNVAPKSSTDGKLSIDIEVSDSE